MSNRDRSAADALAALTLPELMAQIAQHCDIQERLTLVPPSAKVRGIFYRSIEAALGDPTLLRRYRELLPSQRATLQWHPCADFLEHLVVGASLLRGPAQVHEGMLEIGRSNAREFASSLLGRILLRFLSRDPKKLLLQATAGRRQTCGYGQWEISFPDERSAVVSMHEEYLYIESYAIGSARGTFEAVGQTVQVRCELDTRFEGRHFLRW